MPLSWSEIRHRAIAFSREWQGETREAAERQSFWNDFFNVFGVRLRPVAEFESIKADRSTRRTARLHEIHEKLAKLRFLDTACGCSNFLVVTYRELRKLELEVLLELYGQQHEMSLDDVPRLSKVNVDQFYGIEIEEFPARIAEVALCLTDHRANIALSPAFGQFYDRLPLRVSRHTLVGNALHTDWRTVLPPGQCSFVLGNPPSGGKHGE